MNPRFEALRANRLNVMNTGLFCESIRANRPDSRYESPGHLRTKKESQERTSENEGAQDEETWRHGLMLPPDGQ